MGLFHFFGQIKWGRRLPPFQVCPEARGIRNRVPAMEKRAGGRGAGVFTRAGLSEGAGGL